MCPKTRTKKNLKPFQTLVASMYDKAFCIDTLLRKVSNYYRTNKFPSGKSFSLMNRVNGHAVRCSVASVSADNVYLIFVDWSSKWGENVHFEFHVDSNKGLLKKLLKQELI